MEYPSNQSAFWYKKDELPLIKFIRIDFKSKKSRTGAPFWPLPNILKKINTLTPNDFFCYDFGFGLWDGTLDSQINTFDFINFVSPPAYNFLPFSKNWTEEEIYSTLNSYGTLINEGFFTKKIRSNERKMEQFPIWTFPTSFHKNTIYTWEKSFIFIFETEVWLIPSFGENIEKFNQLLDYFRERGWYDLEGHINNYLENQLNEVRLLNSSPNFVVLNREIINDSTGDEASPWD